VPAISKLRQSLGMQGGHIRVPAISKLRQSLGMQGGHIRVPAISKLRQSQWHVAQSHLPRKKGCMYVPAS